MPESVRKILRERRVTGDRAANGGKAGSTSGTGAGVSDDSSMDAQKMKAEALAHLALSVVFLSAYREMVAKENGAEGAALRPLLNQLSLDVAKTAAALQGVETMVDGLAKNMGE